MKSRSFFTLLWLTTAALLLTACHSNEANYKAAYDKAREKQFNGIEQETYNRMVAEAQRNNVEVNGDSLRLVPMWTNVTLDSVAVAKRYGVVVASFKQIFNAQTYRDRLRSEEGFPAYILFEGREKQYYVIVKGFDDLGVAAAFLKSLPTTMKMAALEPKVWILERL